VKHEPVRTQVIDQWVQVFADAVLALLNGTDAILAAHPAGPDPVAPSCSNSPRPLLDREAVLQAFGVVYLENILYDQEIDALADAVMKLARPIPARQQVRDHLSMHWAFATDEEADGFTDAVLALITGNAK
jgi:hypothetical protein